MAYTADTVRYDHRLVIGDTYIVVLRLVESDGTAFDISGATGAAVLRSEPGGVAILTPTVALVTDGSDGYLQWSASAAATAALLPGRARYAVRLTFADSTKRTIVEGVVDLVRVAVD